VPVAAAVKINSTETVVAAAPQKSKLLKSSKSFGKSATIAEFHPDGGGATAEAGDVGAGGRAIGTTA
jgi:hypothetical protein